MSGIDDYPLPPAIRVNEAWRATLVHRWHRDPDLAGSGDTDGAHSCRVALLVIMLFPLSVSEALLRAAVQHDLGEAGAAGDVSAASKAADPVLARALESAEKTERARLGLREPRLSDREARILTFADRLDGFLWMRQRAPWLESAASWQKDLRWLRLEGVALGIGSSCLGAL